MRFMNEHDIEWAVYRFSDGCAPNLAVGACLLQNLANYADRNSDGWAYWPKPAKSASKLMALIESADRFDPQDITTAELNAALRPIKAFLTRQGVPHSVVFGGVG